MTKRVKSLQLTKVLRILKCSHSQENQEKALRSETTIPIFSTSLQQCCYLQTYNL